MPPPFAHVQVDKARCELGYAPTECTDLQSVSQWYVRHGFGRGGHAYKRRGGRGSGHRYASHAKGLCLPPLLLAVLVAVVAVLWMRVFGQLA
jgi:hypothetical protein